MTMNQPFIHDDFLLHGEPARDLYHRVAKHLPIIDYHCHLPISEIAGDRRFDNLTAIWLDGDHYKWRAMRSNGVDEALCTGDADPYEKFLAWARTVPNTYRNPLYHWTHLELSRYFGIDELLDESTAPSIWERANAVLREPEFSARGILGKMNVEVVCTTDDPADDLEAHRALAANPAPAAVYPAYRPDKALAIEDGAAWRDYVDRLSATAGVGITDFDSFMDALRQRHEAFHALGCRLSDHGLNVVPTFGEGDADVADICKRVLDGGEATAEEAEQFAAAILSEVGRWNARRGWTMQLHLGALRAVNSRKTREIGRDCGFDSIGDWSQADRLARFLDRLDAEENLPKTILYNLNPSDNYVFGTMIGNFNDGSLAGKVQLGSGWWFLDQREAMEWQLNALSNLGLLRHFVGMLTDSRSFLSYCRHEYFRRVLCNLLGGDVERGELPYDRGRLSEYVTAICHGNAKSYFAFGGAD